MGLLIYFQPLNCYIVVDKNRTENLTVLKACRSIRALFHSFVINVAVEVRIYLQSCLTRLWFILDIYETIQFDPFSLKPQTTSSPAGFTTGPLSDVDPCEIFFVPTKSTRATVNCVCKASRVEAAGAVAGADFHSGLRPIEIKADSVVSRIPIRSGRNKNKFLHDCFASGSQFYSDSCDYSCIFINQYFGN